MDTSQIVIGPDGTILAASEDLSRLVDIRLEQCETLPPEIRERGKALLQQLARVPNRVASQTVPFGGNGHSLQLIAVEALALRRTATDIRELLSSKLAVLSFQAQDLNVALKVDVAPDVPAVARLDAEKLAWAVTTLVGNALRYMQPGARHFGGKVIDVRARAEQDASQIVIEVRDDGPGIPADTVARLFRHDGLNVRGAGLALLLIRDVMAAHGGTIDVRSSTAPAAHGTTVRLTFPVR